MDFTFNEEQTMIQDQVEQFIQKEYDWETRQELSNSDLGFGTHNWKTFAELGWLTVPFSEEDGGLGGSAVDLMVMMEEFGKANLVEPYLPSVVLSGCLISELATGEVKGEILEKLVGGDLQLAFAAAESGSRFNSAKVATTAESNGNNVVINGKKIAVIGTGASGVQTIQEVCKVAGHLTVFQRRPNWCAPLHNDKISKHEMEEIRSSYKNIFQRCWDTVGGFLHTMDPRGTFEVSEQEREDFWEELYQSRGFGIWQGNFKDMLIDPEANKLMSQFVANKIRSRAVSYTHLTLPTNA